MTSKIVRCDVKKVSLDVNNDNLFNRNDAKNTS